MRNNILLALLLCLLACSCGDYAAMEAVETNKKTADSLFRAHRDTLNKSFKPICDSVYKVQYDIAVDSIKQLRIEGIKGLIDPEKSK